MLPVKGDLQAHAFSAVDAFCNGASRGQVHDDLRADDAVSRCWVKSATRHSGGAAAVGADRGAYAGTGPSQQTQLADGSVQLL
ncbi:hypothetical protein ACS49_04635 [Bacillus cereus]|nr:hypothetical protein ACS49_04635 [Bacillus cereus]